MRTILLILFVGLYFSIQAQSDRVGIGTDAPEKDVHILSSGSNAELLIAPKDLSNGDTATVFLSEDHDGTFGMGMRYDGQDDVLRFFGKRFTTFYPAHLSISRTTGNIGINKEVGNTQLDVDGTIRSSDLLGTGLAPVHTNSTGDLVRGNTSKKIMIGPTAVLADASGTPIMRAAPRSYVDGYVTGSLFVPLQLPVGSQISKITVYYEDNNTVGDITVLLKIFDVPAGAFSSKNIMSSSGSSTGIKSAIYASPISILDDYSFQFEINSINGTWSGAGTMAFRGIEIEYTTL